ncbi:MAG: hypothetical protein LBI53_01880 [Candidatus Peribacteria bacterium]|jgi:hypothetical protein|nr:hypothetical protein [Candidatus Peribacteria bacterium]
MIKEKVEENSPNNKTFTFGEKIGTIPINLIEGLKLKVRKEDQINGLTAPEALDFLIKNFSLNSPDELYSVYGIQELRFIDKIFYAENMNFQNIQEKNKEEFIALLASLSEKQQRELYNNVYAAVNGYTYITIYNHDYIMELQAVQADKSLIEAELEYFEGVKREMIPDLYKKSTLSHEVAHSIRNNDIYINDNLLSKRHNIIKEYGSLTKYAEMYNQEKFIDKEDYFLYLNENFAEAVRMYTVNPPYVENFFPKVYTFLKKNFSFIQPISSFSLKREQ